ncbi:MAG: hypothetical protein K8I29_05565 [Alphaproteobacteria bacterium]|uniref:Outer membrane protein assembly factor BamD n=1 Tax=Candidatus Nitrobium versatile TaxID=2884831 RepID=A0A953J9P3_9BACT|nr:hypothetical protein [Candidatus Nitrobium versatile]
MRYTLAATVLAAGLLFSGCTGDKAAELYDTAKFEELQNNKEHAVQLYEEIVAKYPRSDYAKKAEERLAELKGKRP